MSRAISRRSISVRGDKRAERKDAASKTDVRGTELSADTDLSVVRDLVFSSSSSFFVVPLEVFLGRAKEGRSEARRPRAGYRVALSRRASL